MAAKKKIEEENDLEKYYSHIYQVINENNSKDPYGQYLSSRVASGKKKVFNKTQTEIRNFDMSFLDVIESTYPALLKILKDPKKSIKYEQEIVAVEKAKKVNSDTVRHLSSHTHLIKEIRPDNSVVPSKVLTTYAEEEIAIYENRFIKSLIKRIEMFIEHRYELMKESLESYETQKLNVEDKFMLSGQEVTINLDVSIKNDISVDLEVTKEQYNRLIYVRDLIQSLKGTEFMRALAKAPDVLPPIMKTNIILHNPDFKLCYNLWIYLDNVDGIETNIDVKEKAYRYTSNFEKDINDVMTLALTSFIKNRSISDVYASKKLPQVKAPKAEKNNNLELELNLKPDNNKMEDYRVNEVLLSETAKFFDASLEANYEATGKYYDSVRVVYRQMLDMIDQIYRSTFKITEDKLDTLDDYDQLEYLRNKAETLKIVRNTKQASILKMAREEKTLQTQIERLEKKIEKEEEKKRKEELAKEKENKKEDK